MADNLQKCDTSDLTVHTPHMHTHTHHTPHTTHHTPHTTHHTHTHTDMCDDLSTLYERLFTARNEWCDIGLKLKLSIESLNEIELKHNSKTCLRKMLEKQLKTVGPLSWREVCACLRFPTVGRNDVADIIEEWRKGTVDSGNRLFA